MEQLSYRSGGSVGSAAVRDRQCRRDGGRAASHLKRERSSRHRASRLGCITKEPCVVAVCKFRIGLGASHADQHGPLSVGGTIIIDTVQGATLTGDCARRRLKMSAKQVSTILTADVLSYELACRDWQLIGEGREMWLISLAVPTRAAIAAKARHGLVRSGRVMTWLSLAFEMPGYVSRHLVTERSVD